MAFTEETYYDGAQWKGVCDNVSGYFNGYFKYKYDSQYSTGISRLIITEYGVRKVRQGPVNWNGATGIVKIEATGGNTRSTSRSLGTNNADFGSTSPSRVAWWIGEWIIDYERTSAAATKNIKVTASKSSGTKWGGSASGTFQITVPAKTKYTVSFDGNGATGGSTASVEANLNSAATLPSCGFTRTDYSFASWNTNADGTGTSYAAGAKPTFSQDTVLYAQWGLAYIAPTLAISAYRVTSSASGASPSSVADGTRGFCKVTISGGTYKSGTYPTVQFVFKNGNTTVATVNATRSSLTYYGYTANSLLNKDIQYTVIATATIADKNSINHTQTKATYISAEKYTMDIAANQKRVHFFGQATDGKDNDPAVEVQGDIYLFMETSDGLYQKLNTLGWISEVSE